MENLKEIIDKKYPKGLDYEFTKEEKTGYLIAIKDIEEALAISRVVERSEQLVCVVDYLSNFTKGKKYECKPDGQNYVETYDDFGDWYSVHQKCFSRTEVAN